MWIGHLANRSVWAWHTGPPLRGNRYRTTSAATAIAFTKKGNNKKREGTRKGEGKKGEREEKKTHLLTKVQSRKRGDDRRSTEICRGLCLKIDASTIFIATEIARDPNAIRASASTELKNYIGMNR